MSATEAADRGRRDVRRSKKGNSARQRLRDAAKEIFEEEGFLDTRVSDIAERANVSAGSFYHYFGSKDEILFEVTEDLSRLLNASWSEVVFDRDAKTTAVERIREGNRRFLESYRDEARIIGAIEQVSRVYERIELIRMEERMRHRPRLVHSIRQLQQRGLADPRLDAETALIALGSMVDGFAESWLVQRAVHCTLDEAVEQVTRLFANGLRLRPPAPAP